MDHEIGLSVTDINVPLVKGAGMAPNFAVRGNVFSDALVKCCLDFLARRRPGDLTHVIPLPIHARIGVAGNHRVLSSGDGGTGVRMALKSRFVTQILSWSLDQVIHCPSSHSI